MRRLHETRRPSSDQLSDWGMRYAAEQARDFLDQNPPPYDPDEVGRWVARRLTDVPEAAVVQYVKDYLAYYRGIPGPGADRPGGVR